MQSSAERGKQAEHRGARLRLRQQAPGHPLRQALHHLAPARSHRVSVRGRMGLPGAPQVWVSTFRKCQPCSLWEAYAAMS